MTLLECRMRALCLVAVAVAVTGCVFAPSLALTGKRTIAALEKQIDEQAATAQGLRVLLEDVEAASKADKAESAVLKADLAKPSVEKAVAKFEKELAHVNKLRADMRALRDAEERPGDANEAIAAIGVARDAQVKKAEKAREAAEKTVLAAQERLVDVEPWKKSLHGIAMTYRGGTGLVVLFCAVGAALALVYSRKHWKRLKWLTYSNAALRGVITKMKKEKS